MKAFLNLFRQFTEIDFRDSRFGFQNNAVRLDAADRGIFVCFAVKRFEVVGKASDPNKDPETSFGRSRRKVRHIRRPGPREAGKTPRWPFFGMATLRVDFASRKR